MLHRQRLIPHQTEFTVRSSAFINSRRDLRTQVNHDVVIDTSLDPSVYVTRVYTTLEDGAYGVGEEIPIILVFSHL